MNQILVSEKIYVTPDMKHKKRFFKVEFILSVFLVCILSTYAIYAEYDRNKSEDVSQEILKGIQFQEIETTTTIAEVESDTVTVAEDVIVVILNEAFSNEGMVEIEEIEVVEEIPEAQQTITSSGHTYYTIGVINIPKIGVNYPILSETSVASLKIAPGKFWGPDPNQEGNLCIAGHNYRNNQFFSKVPNLQNGDTIEITDLTGKTLEYTVYDKYIVTPEDTNCTSQITNGRTEITLITCTNDNKLRHIIKAVAQ